jgi:bifunctional UDP-N-acetylglucosamine pyrophosphorylase/glucosamine-1-phosphate N-acetyltransferase
MPCRWRDPSGKTKGALMLLSGDVPLICQHSSASRTAILMQAAVARCLNCSAESFGLWRVLRNSAGEVERIVEQRDASPRIKDQEVNTGIYCFEITLAQIIDELTCKNSQAEYYLTVLSF